MTEHIPRDFIDQLLNRVDIVDLIDSRITLRKKTGNNFFACCPFHNEKNPSFSVSQVKQFYYCFGCGAHGNAIDFLIEYDRLNFPEAIETLAKQIGMEVPRQTNFRSPEKVAAQQSLYDLLDQVAKFYQNQLRQHKDAERAVEYLKHRGVSGVIAKDFGIGLAPQGWDHVLQAFEKSKLQLFEAGMLIKKDEGGFYDRFRDRIMFPIHDRRGRIIGFGGRIIDVGEPKYLNSPETPIFQKGHELYGLYQALQANRQLTRIIVVEGYMDVIALFQNQITYAVATLGTATSANHLERLFRHTSEIIFCFDGDTAGRTAAWRALQVTLPLMRDGIQVRFMFLPEGEDPDSLVRKEGKEHFEQRMLNASTISDFFFQTIATQTDMSSTDGRARYVKLATDLLKQIPEGIFQQMMLAELAKRARIDIEQLKPRSPTATQTTQQKPAPSLKARPPSPLRVVMTLLIQQPSLVELITTPIPLLDLNGYDLLVQLIEKAKQNPKVTTGGLLEHWRDQPDGKLLAKLAQWEHMIPEAGVQHEFIGALNNLSKLAHGNAIENLLAKAAQIGLSPEEKQSLSELITSKK
ncbi:MAG: DNA primase [Gammaproteobacteria bacterium]|nr:DNA primase [Gammaproteobacteria bacterium]